MTERIVSDTGPLISLESLKDGFDFIQKIYKEIIIPPAVRDEVSEHYPSFQSYLKHYKIENLITVQSIKTEFAEKKNANLHSGEYEAIVLALELKLPLLIEETSGRKYAASIGIDISGIAKQVVLAFQKECISFQTAVNKLDELLSSNRINVEVYDRLVTILKR